MCTLVRLLCRFKIFHFYFIFLSNFILFFLSWTNRTRQRRIIYYWIIMLKDYCVCYVVLLFFIFLISQSVYCLSSNEVEFKVKLRQSLDCGLCAVFISILLWLFWFCLRATELLYVDVFIVNYLRYAWDRVAEIKLQQVGSRFHDFISFGFILWFIFVRFSIFVL